MTNVSLTLNELEYAGAMKFRFIDVLEEDYQGGVPFSPADANLNRFQHVLVSVQDPSEGQFANYHSATDEITVASGGTELSGGATVTLDVVAIGR